MKTYDMDELYKQILEKVVKVSNPTFIILSEDIRDYILDEHKKTFPKAETTAEDGHERIAGLIISIVAPSVKDFIEIR